MSQVNLEFVERYQLEYEKNPHSKIFAPLAEAYRKMGLLEEAHRICLKGVQIHPTFAGGRVAFAKVLLDRNEPEKALAQLEGAIQISPDNLLAHTLMGDTLLQLRRPKDALKAFKMVLFLNPNDERARQAVRKWEFLSADDYEDDLFQMKPIFKAQDLLGPKGEEPAPVLKPLPGAPIQPIPAGSKRGRALERAVSLADAYTVRGDMDKALATLLEARMQLGPLPELEKRIELISKRAQQSPGPDRESADDNSDDDDVSDFSGVTRDPAELRRRKLETFLRRINERRH